MSHKQKLKWPPKRGLAGSVRVPVKTGFVYTKILVKKNKISVELLKAGVGAVVLQAWKRGSEDRPGSHSKLRSIFKTC